MKIFFLKNIQFIQKEKKVSIIEKKTNNLTAITIKACFGATAWN